MNIELEYLIFSYSVRGSAEVPSDGTTKKPEAQQQAQRQLHAQRNEKARSAAASAAAAPRHGAAKKPEMQRQAQRQLQTVRRIKADPQQAKPKGGGRSESRETKHATKRREAPT